MVRVVKLLDHQSNMTGFHEHSLRMQRLPSLQGSRSWAGNSKFVSNGFPCSLWMSHIMRNPVFESVRLKPACYLDLLYCLGSEQQRHWSDCADAHADLRSLTSFAYGINRFSRQGWNHICLKAEAYDATACHGGLKLNHVSWRMD